MKRYIVVVVVLALGWAGFWAVRAQATKGALEAWFDARRADGWEASYADISVSGFPSRLDVSITEPVLMDRSRGVGWQAPFLQILGLTYRPGHVIVAWPPTQVLTLPDGDYRIDSEGLRASLVTQGDGAILRTNVEAEVLNVDGPKRDMALAGLRAAFAGSGAGATVYRLGVHADALARTESALGGGRADALEVQAELQFDEIWRLSSLGGPRPQPVMIDLRLAEYKQAVLEVNMTGRMDIDGAGRPDGTLSVRAKNWRDALGEARANGALPEGLATTVEQALTLAAGVSGRRDTLDVTLSLDDGDAAIGILPLGPAPRLRLP